MKRFKVSEQIEPLPLIPRGTSLDEKLSIAKRRGEKRTLEQEKVAAETPRQLFLPGFEIGTMPNHINRSSLFAPIARGSKRKYHNDVELFSRSDCVIKYTGEQLDEADCDIFMTLISFACSQPIGEFVLLNRAELLRELGRNTGRGDYMWLHRRIKSMRAGILYIEARKNDGSIRYTIGSETAMNVIADFIYDERREAYAFKLDPRIVIMFGNREYSRIDWGKRTQIRNDMAKRLQRLVATSSNQEQRYSLDSLKKMVNYYSPTRKFREALLLACDELIRLDIIAKRKIDVSSKGKLQLILWRNPVDK